MVWCVVVWCDVVWCGVAWCDVVWWGVMRCDVMWCGVMWCDVMVWYGMGRGEPGWDRVEMGWVRFILCSPQWQPPSNGCESERAERPQLEPSPSLLE